MFSVFMAPVAAVVAPSNMQVVGNVRVEALSPSLVRLEVKGPRGFEDRATFHIVQRQWAGAPLTRREANGTVILQSSQWSVQVPAGATSLEGITIVDTAGKTLYTAPKATTNAAWLPAPSERTAAWAIADTPRLVPPSWGATPPPAGNTQFPETSGWDAGSDAPDVYVFLPQGGDYRQLRRDYLRLTGPTELPPLYLFGMFHSRYYPYAQDEAQGIITKYRTKKIPLDVMVLDTDWRVGASVGYAANTKLFPDLPGYLKSVHTRGIKTMFNDHPEPKVDKALDPAELAYRYEGLSQWMNQGMDIWWYDRNWGISLKSPISGLRHEVWGMQVYHDMTQRAAPGRRPAIMANVDGIDNGIRNRPPDSAAHRFPIQWTGDTTARWRFLRYGVENATYSGVHSLVPYMSEDLGGHNGGQPSPELYVRFMEYGALSPTMRPHCTAGSTRAPWDFGPEAERIITDYTRMRYRLLPYLYTAARNNYDNGEPLVRRLDLDYPKYSEATALDQYLFGRDLLVAPIVDGPPDAKAIPGSWLTTPDGQPGLKAEYFTSKDLSGTAAHIRTDANIDFGQSVSAPGIPEMNFSARWTGKIQNRESEPMVLTVTSDDGVRVYLDGKLVIDEWHPSDGSTQYTSKVALAPGKTYDLRVEYMQLTGGSLCVLGFQKKTPPPAQRTVWIPPGTWTNAWNGARVVGPKKISVAPSLAQIPLFVRPGAIIPLVPQMQYTSERPWNRMALDIFPAVGQTTSTNLYEDDTATNGYQKGAFRFTRIETAAQPNNVRVTIQKVNGKSFPGAVAARSWTLRLHNAGKGRPTQVLVNGKSGAPWRLLPRATAPNTMPFQTEGRSPDGEVLQIDLPTTAVGRTQTVTVRY